jgi:hypothetical protein
MTMAPVLSDYTPDEQNTMPYEDLCKLRRQAWAAHMATMTAPDALAAWEATIIKRHGPKVQVWANQLPWMTALMVVRYGEAIGFWPAAFDAKDVQRAQEWTNGRIPYGVKIIDPE